MNKKNELVGIAWFAAGILLLAALFVGLFAGHGMGILGRYIQLAFFYIFGFASFLIPVIFGFIGYYSFKKNELKKPFYKITGAVLLLAGICLLFYLVNIYGDYENMLGNVLGIVLVKLIDLIGAWLVCGLLFIFALYFLELEHLPKDFLRIILDKFQRWKEDRPAREAEREAKKAKKAMEARKAKEEKEARKAEKEREAMEEREAKEEKEAGKANKAQKAETEKPEPKPKPVEKKTEKNLKPLKGEAPGGLEVKQYSLPSFDLLSDYESAAKMSKEDFSVKENIIKVTLADFGIEVEPTRAIMGPVITRYEMTVAAGQKVNRIVSLSNDLAMALRATHIRIIAPIPGTNAVGIEVPNKKSSTVSLKSIIDSGEFNNPSFRLPISIGKTVDGENMVADLADMPHLLVAGATGAGKSVCLNSIIISLIYKFKPDELKILLIDPKRVEFTLYNEMPHLYTPVITDVRKASEALKHLVRDMTDRYDKLSKAHARDIVSYNKKAEVKLPYVVVIIDELADMMLLAAREIEDVITRLAQLARGVGIHLVFATQRPSVDVITGVIKANFPSRIALQVFSKVDSRVILDTGGAEDLLGKGDMLFSLASFPRSVRCQCSYISTTEIKNIMDFWTAQGEPTMVNIEVKSEGGMKEGDGEDNELFINALVFVKERKRASVQLLQGAFHISGGRATNLISLMESKGLIGPGVGNKPRDINFDKIEEILKKFKKG